MSNAFVIIKSVLCAQSMVWHFVRHPVCACSGSAFQVYTHITCRTAGTACPYWHFPLQIRLPLQHRVIGHSAFSVSDQFMKYLLQKGIAKLRTLLSLIKNWMFIYWLLWTPQSAVIVLLFVYVTFYCQWNNRAEFNVP